MYFAYVVSQSPKHSRASNYNQKKKRQPTIEKIQNYKLNKQSPDSHLYRKIYKKFKKVIIVKMPNQVKQSRSQVKQRSY